MSINCQKCIRLFIFFAAMFMALAAFGIQSASATTVPSYDQLHFRFKNDAGGETSTDWIDIEDASIVRTQNNSFRLRIHFNQANNVNGTVTPLVEFKAASGGACGDAAGWTTITTATTNAFALYDSSNFTEPISTSNQLTVAGGTAFLAGELLDQTNPGSGITLKKQGTEYEWNITATVNSVAGTAYIFRVSNNGTSLNTYTVCPQVTINSPPNAPSQDSPANGATGQSVTPTFAMTATDPDSDDLGYKVVIYSESGCTTVVQTHEQAVDSTGWTGTDAACVSSPANCYASGTQGNFTVQAGDALTAATQYWWEASAKDPDGVGTYAVSATCNTFTTAASASLTFIVSTDTFPAITPGTPVFATTTLNIDTDNASGWNIALYGDDQGLTDTVMDLDSDAGTGITDQTEWIPGAATTTAGNAVRISSLDNSGDVLAFRVMTASGTPSFISSSWWGSVDSYSDDAGTLWAGIASSSAANLKLGDSSVDSGGGSVLSTVLYYLDVSDTQQTGSYAGNLTFTATMNP